MSIMIWFLLRHLRGTSDPLTLPKNHWLRRCTSRLGAIVARHALPTVVVAVVLGVYISVPVPYLYQPTLSINNSGIRDRAWSSIQRLPAGEDVIPDIYIRQVWIQASWMGALERETLIEAVGIQEVLFGNPIEPSAVDDASFIHSPLQYWDCSVAVIQSTNPISNPINTISRPLSPANITLTPETVFLGQRWSGNRFVAADTLVASLFYRAGSWSGECWDERVKALAQSNEGRWDIYSKDDEGTGSKLFKFESRPVSLKDEAAFFIAYDILALLVVFGFRHLRSMRSKIRLLVMITMQGFLSIRCTFTVAAFLHLDIPSIPLEAYPFIVVVGGLDNVFHLVNEVEKTPLLDQHVHRVSTALSAVSHLLLIAVSQNLFILLLASATIPGLAAFCRFVALSLVIDLVIFATFFVAMLTMNLRSYGMQDSFDDAAQLNERKIGARRIAGRRFALQQQKSPAWRPRKFTSWYPRVTGTVAILLFLGLLAWNYPHRNITFEFGQIFSPVLSLSGAHTLRSYPTHFNPTNGETANSRSWLELQEHSTMREILSLATPRSQGFVARIYSPLIVTRQYAARGLSANKTTFLPFPIDDFTPSRPWQFIFISCCLLAFVISTYASLSPSSEEESQAPKSDSLSSIQYLHRGHSLDVYILSTSEKPYMASVGFDHELRFWNLDSRNSGSSVPAFSDLHGLWPVVAISCDDRGEWLAICSKLGDVGIWNVKDRSFRRCISTSLTQIILCLFMTSSPRDSQQPVPPLLIVSGNGILADIDSESGSVTFHRICARRIRSCQLTSRRRIPLRLITVTEDNEIYLTVKREDCWASQALHIPLAILPQPARFLYTVIPDLKMVALAFSIDTQQLHLIDFLSGASIYKFQPNHFKHHTLRAIHSPRQQCLSCGAVALTSFSIGYTEVEDNRFTMCTLSAEQNQVLRTSSICLRADRDVRERRCIGLDSSIENSYSIPHAGAWEATAANGVAGVRRRHVRNTDAAHENVQDGLFFRRREKRVQRCPPVDGGVWEAWTMTATGIINIHPLHIDVLASQVGPMMPLGRNAIAVALAEQIVLIRFGTQIHDNDDDDSVAVATRRPTHIRSAGRLKPS